jgi:hypothetical protein
MPGHSDSPKFLKSPDYGVLYSFRIARLIATIVIQGEPGLPRIVLPMSTPYMVYYNLPIFPGGGESGLWRKMFPGDVRFMVFYMAQ